MKITLPMLAALLMPLSAAAQLREGLYEVQGSNPDGSGYGAALALQAAPGASWLVTWQVDQTRISGLGLVQGGVFAVSFVVNGRPGIAAYEVQSDGTLRGTWTTGGGLGTETLIPR